MTDISFFAPIANIQPSDSLSERLTTARDIQPHALLMRSGMTQS